MQKKTLFCCFFSLLFILGKAQQCTFNGQTPVSAIFVCSDQTLSISTAQFCGQTTVPNPCTNGASYQNVNPHFFRFACYSAGTLGFTVSPNDATTDYNWQLFDITSTNPVDIFTNPGLFVACNWSGEPGDTGASIDGVNTMVCSGLGGPLFSKMPDLLAGKTYLLMVTNHSASGAGYNINFAGGSAIITDPIEPHLLITDLSCDRTKVTLRLNKLVKCNTVASDGSDFSLSTGANVINAVPTDCSNQLSTSSVILTLDQPLALGTYTLTINNGNDGNTLTDICNRNIPGGESIPLIAAPPQFSPMDSLFNIACNPGYLELVFIKPIRCNSVAANGSDFIITGPQPVTATPFLTTCNANGLTNIIRLNIAGSMQMGNYQIRLTSGTDGNTILNDCGIPTPAGATIPFTVAQAVDADFTTNNNASCSQSTVAFFHTGGSSVNSWNWSFGNGATSTQTNPVINFAKGNYNVRLIVTNGICSDTSTQVIKISDGFKAAFDLPAMVCPGDQLTLTDKSTGNVDGWQWSFGNGQTSNTQTPQAFSYADLGRDIYYTIRLVVTNSVLGCSDATTRTVRVLGSCFIAVPNAFTPNGDGKNDYLYPLNAVKADNLEFNVYNRIGQLVFTTRDWTRKWDGKINGALQDTGVYAWILSYTHHDTGEKVLLKGTTLLLR